MPGKLPARPRTDRFGRFAGKLVLVLLDNKDGPSLRAGRSLWAVQRALEYQVGDDPNELIVVPPGFVTDLASVPRAVWSFYPPDGPWAKAAIIHDFLYTTKGTGKWNAHVGITRADPYTRQEADGVLREAMADRKVGKWEQSVIWASVRLGGAGGWGH